MFDLSSTFWRYVGFTKMKYKNDYRIMFYVLHDHAPSLVRARVIHATRRVSRMTTNFTKCRAFRDCARSGSFLGGKKKRTIVNSSEIYDGA